MPEPDISTPGGGDATSGDFEAHVDEALVMAELGGLIAAAGEDWSPDAGLFTHPEPERPVPLQVDGDHIYGHLALWETPHIGIDGKRVTPPRDSDGLYRMYSRKTIVAADGSKIPVGKITMDTGHASLSASAPASIAHYDNTGTLAAVVTMRDGRFGPFFSGAVLPTLSDAQRLALGLAEVSGDWRYVGGRLQLVAALAVNTPGFPVAEARIEDGKPLAMVAAGMISRSMIDGVDTSMVPAIVTAVLDEMARRDAAVLAAARERTARSELTGILTRLRDDTAHETLIAALAGLDPKEGL